MRFNDQLIDVPNLYHVIDRYPLTINPDSYVINAILLMNQERSNSFALTNFNPSFNSNVWSQQETSYVLVVEGGQLLGIFTERDLVRFTASGMDFAKVKMTEVMTQQLITLTPSDSQDIFTALSLLRQHQIRHLPLVDDGGQLLGIVTEKILLQAFDLVTMVGVVEALQQNLQQPQAELKQENEQVEAVRWQTQTNLRQWVEAESAEFIQVNQELQQALKELQVVEEELRQQNEELAVAREIAELERQRYQDLFEFAPDGYLVTDADGIIRETNHAAANLLSVRQKYLVGKPLVVFIAQQDRQTFITQLRNLQHLQQWEVFLQPRDGVPFPANIRVSGVSDAQGKRIGFRWLLSNISDRKQVEEALRQATDELEKRVAERTAELSQANLLLQQEIIERKQMGDALRESNEKFRHFAENTQAVIWIASPDVFQEALYASPAFEKIWGRSCQSLCDQPEVWIETIHPEDRDRVIAKLERQKSCEPTDLEYRILRPDGSVRWIWDRGFALGDEQGKVYSYGGIAEDITERKQAEESLRESEARLSLALEAANMGIWDWNLLTQDKVWSPHMGPLYGLPSGTLCPSIEGFLNLIHPQDREPFSQAVKRSIEQRVEFLIEYRAVWPDGSQHWLNGRGQVYYNDTGQPMRMIGTTRDISDRKQSEAALRESEDLYRSVVTVLREGIVLLNADGNIVACNASAESILGFSAEQMIGNASWKFLWPSIHEDGSPFPSDIYPVALTLQTGESYANVVMGIYKPNGQLNWISINSQPLFHQNDPTLYGVVASFSDITEQQAALHERQQAEQKIREQAALLDIATDAIFVRDFQTKILFWNQGAERLYGWQAHEALGKNPNKLFYPKTSPPQEQAALETVIEFGSWHGELSRLTKSGQEIIVESRWTLMHDDAGQPKSILTVDTDITEKKQLQSQFFRAQRLESLGTLAGGIAHDLNNILTPIMAAAQLLKIRYAKPDDRYHQLLTIIESNSKRGAALVKQVLSFARGFKGERTIVQVKHLIAEIIQIARQTFPKSIEFTTQIPEDLWAVCGDATQLHQVLMNLVVNARDAMPEGGILSICTENMFIDQAYAQMNLDAKVGNYIVITVADTGIGMPPEILDRIFEPFFTTKEVGTGTGLGLSTVLGIIKSHNGFVNVSSQVGKGTEFKLFLPSVEATPALGKDDLEIVPGQGELILVVDDESQIREITKIILENHNYRILTASNGIEAIALYAQHKYQISLVLMDMMMPEMDGSTAIRTLQKMNPQVQIIAFSGLNSTEVFTKSAGIQVQAYLSKPFTAKELLQTLNHILSNQS